MCRLPRLVSRLSSSLLLTELLLSLLHSTFTEAMQIGSETYHHLKKVIQTKYGIDGESSPRAFVVGFSASSS